MNHGRFARFDFERGSFTLPHFTIAAFAVLCQVVSGQSVELRVSGPEKNANGFATYTLQSPYQGRATSVEVLTPDAMEGGARYPVVYLLPVNDGIMNQWGSGIVEARRHGLHNRFQVICVSPEYDYTPWYGDHPTEPALAQESYLFKAVIPMVEERLPALAAPEGRILLGFSKSGFGAVSLALRHPDVIGRAAAWDAPLMMTDYFADEVEMVRVFENSANFATYCIPTLIEDHVATLRQGKPQLVLVSNANEKDSVTALHMLLDEKGVKHRYLVDSRREHTWTSGWLPVVAELLLAGGQPSGRTE